LKDSYKTLKDIESSIKQSDASQGEDKPKNLKRIFLKDFKENKKTIDDDVNILHHDNICVKFKGWCIINNKTNDKNYQLFKSD
jgi:hypothetical protein